MLHAAKQTEWIKALEGGIRNVELINCGFRILDFGLKGIIIQEFRIQEFRNLGI